MWYIKSNILLYLLEASGGYFGFAFTTRCAQRYFVLTLSEENYTKFAGNLDWGYDSLGLKWPPGAFL